MPPDLDQLFHAYRRHGDLRALGALFDRVAPELHRIARHLLRDSDDADDAVQEAFVTLVEARDQFDERRAVLPWLVGILVHRARRALRERARTRRQAPSDGAVQIADPSAASQPPSALEQRELRTRLERAITGLPTRYRDVVYPYLVDAEVPGDIAAALHRSPSTVRSQLQRGLAMLRNALPAGLAIATLRPALRAARRAVLQRARQLESTPHRVVPLVPAAAAIALIVTAFAGWQVWSWLAPPPPSPANAADLPAPATAAVSPNADRTPTPPPPPHAPQLLATTITGRCVDASGRPISGCGITLSGQPDSAGAARYGGLASPEPLRGTTDDQGRFTLVARPHPACRYGLRVEHPDYVGVAATWSSMLLSAMAGVGLQPGTEVDLGDLVMRPGQHVRGVLRDLQGRPLQATITASVRISDVLGGNAASHFVRGRSDGEGAFALEQPLPPGDWPLSVSGHRIEAGPRRLAIAGGTRPAKCELTAAPTRLITGQLVDEGGAPVAHALLQAGNRMVRTRADGRFKLPSADAAPAPVRLRPSQGSGLTALWIDEPIEFGTAGLRLVARREPLPTLTIRAFDSSTGAPVEEFAWQLSGTAGMPMVRRQRGEFGAHSGGVAIAERVAPGDLIVSVIPRRDRYRAQPRVPVAVDFSDAEVAVALEPVVPLRVRVVREGTPCPGCWVDLLRCPDDPPIAGTGGVVLHHVVGDDDRVSLQLDAASTDRFGDAILHAALHERIAVRALAPDGTTSAAADIVVEQANSEIVLQLPASATFRGRVIPSSVAALGVSIRLRRGDQTRAGAAVGARGTFGPFSAPAGTWQVDLWRRTDTSLGFGWRELLRGVATVQLVAGQERVATLAAHAAAPGVVVLQVTRDGAPLTGASVSLVGSPDAPRSPSLGLPLTTHSTEPTPLDATGRHTFTALAPMRYRARIHLEDPATGTLDQHPLRGVIVVGPGARIEHSVEWRPPLLQRISVHDAAGHPRADADLLLLRSDTPLPTPVRTDVHGHFLLPPAPGVTFRLRALDAAHTTAPFVVPPAPPAAVVPVLLPRGKV